MRKLITTIALLALVGTSVAIAQRAGSSTNPDKQLRLLADAPVGHRQPRADQVPSEKNPMDDEKNPMDDSINRENAALDRMINGICRGC